MSSLNRLSLGSVTDPTPVNISPLGRSDSEPGSAQSVALPAGRRRSSGRPVDQNAFTRVNDPSRRRPVGVDAEEFVPSSELGWVSPTNFSPTLSPKYDRLLPCRADVTCSHLLGHDSPIFFQHGHYAAPVPYPVVHTPNGMYFSPAMTPTGAYSPVHMQPAFFGYPVHFAASPIQRPRPPRCDDAGAHMVMVPPQYPMQPTFHEHMQPTFHEHLQTVHPDPYAAPYQPAPAPHRRAHPHSPQLPPPGDGGHFGQPHL